MAEAFVTVCGGGRVTAASAGTRPSPSVSPVVAEAMKEKSIDITGNRPKAISDEMVRRSKRIVTMGCDLDDACPAPLLGAEDWGLPDPSGLPLEEVRPIRDEIEARVLRLLEELGAGS